MEMRNNGLYLIISGLCFLAALGASGQVSPPAPPPFYKALAQHGTWRNETGYGWYWMPSEAELNPAWRPYLQDGSWQWADGAWSWSASTVWGSTVFHYGRWANIESKGWIWVPDDEYAPAWVEWVRSDGYWGWAPMLPEPGISPGFELSVKRSSNDFVWVPEGDLSAPSLEELAVLGIGSGSASLTGVAGVDVVQPSYIVPQVVVPPAVVEPSTVVVYRDPPLYTAPYFSLGASWWYWDRYPRYRYYGGRHRRHVSPRPSPGIVHPRPGPLPRPVSPTVQRRPTARAGSSVLVPRGSRSPSAGGRVSSGVPHVSRPASPARPAPGGGGMSRRAQGARNLLNRR